MNRERALAMIEKHEGFVALPYRDSKGYWTVGCGELISRDTNLTYQEACDLCLPLPWTHQRARARIGEHLDKIETRLDHAIPWWRALGAGPQLVLVDLAYNMGVGSSGPPSGLLGFRHMLNAAQAGDIETAIAEMVDSQWARDVGLERVNDNIALWREA